MHGQSQPEAMIETAYKKAMKRKKLFQVLKKVSPKVVTVLMQGREKAPCCIYSNYYE
jgi:hypothetical protein